MAFWILSSNSFDDEHFNARDVACRDISVACAFKPPSFDPCFVSI
jgi:hypothetical protein